MARYLARRCPKCNDYLGVVVPEPKAPDREAPIKAVCLRCGYELPMRNIIKGGRKLAIALLAAVSFILTTLITAYPHGGGLDAYGCHHDRKRGGYHCHRGQFSGQSFGSKDEMLRKLKATETDQPPQKKPAAKPTPKE